MSFKSSWWNFVVLALFAVPAMALADDKYHLAYKFRAGDFYHYDVDDQAEMTTQFGENVSKLRQHTQILKSFRVIMVDDAGSATIEPIMEEIKMASQTADQLPIVYDSTKSGEAPKEFEKVASTVNRPQARFHVSASGRLLKVTMLATDVPKTFSEAAAKTDPSINLVIPMPDQPVKIGDKWSEKFETQVTAGANSTRPIVMIRVYELAAVTNNIASIKIRTAQLNPVNDPEVLRQLVQQTPQGTIEFDMQQGRVLNRTMKIEEKVVGAFGNQSLLQASGTMTERLVDPNLPRVAGTPPSPSLK